MLGLDREGTPLFAKIDPNVKRTTCFIAVCVLALSALMQAVYLIVRAWNPTVLWGNLLGAFVAVLNFFLMGLTIQRSLTYEPEDAKKLVRVSQSGRMLMVLAFCAIGAAVPIFDLLAVLVPLIFPRIGTMLWPLVDKGDGKTWTAEPYLEDEDD